MELVRHVFIAVLLRFRLCFLLGRALTGLLQLALGFVGQAHAREEQGQVQPSLLVVVDEEQIPPNSEQELKEGTTITLLPPIAGGSR